MRKPTVLFILALGLMVSGCASIQYPLPSCDGSARRPLNQSVWDWNASSSAPAGSATGAAPAAPTS